MSWLCSRLGQVVKWELPGGEWTLKGDFNKLLFIVVQSVRFGPTSEKKEDVWRQFKAPQFKYFQ